MFIKNDKINTIDITKSGIALGINIILLFSINYIQSNTVFLMSLSSVLVAIILIETNVKTSTLFSIASIIFSFFILGNKIQFIVYSMTFSYYGIIKYLIESNLEIETQYLVKFIYSTLILSLTVFLVNQLGIKVDFFVLPILILLYFVYDYFYTIAIDYYYKKTRKNT